jgi:hypothetical protein
LRRLELSAAVALEIAEETTDDTLLETEDEEAVPEPPATANCGE